MAAFKKGDKVCVKFAVEAAGGMPTIKKGERAVISNIVEFNYLGENHRQILIKMNSTGEVFHCNAKEIRHQRLPV